MTIEQIFEAIKNIGLPAGLCVAFIWIAYKLANRMVDAHVDYIKILTKAQESQAKSLRILSKCYRRIMGSVKDIKDDGCGHKKSE